MRQVWEGAQGTREAPRVVRRIKVLKRKIGLPNINSLNSEGLHSSVFIVAKLLHKMEPNNFCWSTSYLRLILGKRGSHITFVCLAPEASDHS